MAMLLPLVVPPNVTMVEVCWDTRVASTSARVSFFILPLAGCDGCGAEISSRRDFTERGMLLSSCLSKTSQDHLAAAGNDSEEGNEDTNMVNHLCDDEDAENVEDAEDAEDMEGEDEDKEENEEVGIMHGERVLASVSLAKRHSKSLEYFSSALC